jgi:hypothetical protein
MTLSAYSLRSYVVFVIESPVRLTIEQSGVTVAIIVWKIEPGDE